MRPIILPLTALAAALGLTACQQTATPDDNNADTAMIANDAGAGPDNATPATADTSAEEGTPPDIAAPTVAPDAPAEQATPLVEAAQAAATIASDTSVTRVAWNNGWAWKRDGQIIRTASHDGSRVSYFHPGDDHPYLVQDGGRSYGYDDNGTLAHVYDHGGHPQPPSTTDQRNAGRFDQQARQDHDHARAAPPPPHNSAGNPADHGGQSDRDHAGSSQPSPTHSSTPRNAQGRPEHGNRHDRTDDQNGRDH
jgi:hypothetical protein